MEPPPPDLPDDIVGEFLIRLPPDDPACLLRASLACKRWRRILAGPAFRRRHRELHRAPSVVGFIRSVKGDDGHVRRFVPNNPASGVPAARDLPGWITLDCRHGRVLFLAPTADCIREYQEDRICDLIVWDPLTNEQHRLPRPSPPPTTCGYRFNAAVLCAAAAEGCDHRNCHGGPFRVAFVRTHGHFFSTFDPYVTSARVYSSETGDWSEPTSVRDHPDNIDTVPCRSALVGDTLYFRRSWMHIFEYQLGAQRLSIIDGPPESLLQSLAIYLISMGDGVLGCVDVEEESTSLRLRLWSREAAPSGDGVGRWTKGRAIELERILPDGALPVSWLAPAPPRVPRISRLAFAEGTDVIFVGTHMLGHPSAVYMVQLNSGMARKVFDECSLFIPYTSFCIPVTDAASVIEGTREEGTSSA